ncbi:hypothetical protein [Streptomyces sp. DSM 41013]
MRIRTTAAAVGAVLALALTACSSDETPDRPQETDSSAPASPSADTAAAEQACKDAWSQATENGAIEDGSVSVDNPPAECDGVKNGAGLAADAIREHIQKGRNRMEDCLDDPSCTELPIDPAQ